MFWVDVDWNFVLVFTAVWLSSFVVAVLLNDGEA